MTHGSAPNRPMSKSNAKQRMKKRRDRFVVGYLSRGNIVFCQPRCDGFELKNAGWPMTRLQAIRFLRTMPCNGAAIFELEPIEDGSLTP